MTGRAMRRMGAAAALALSLSAEAAMAWGDGLVLVSPIEGRLVDAEGAPSGGVRVVRRWDWEGRDATGEDAVVTDAAGRFAFAAVERGGLLSRLFRGSASIRVRVSAAGPEGEVELLRLRKASYALGWEAERVGLSGPALSLVCRIDAEPSDEGVYWGTCRAAAREDDR